jgi:FAD/FMN-containing dehydrogenase
VAHGYNPRYDDRSPAAVARCAGAQDVRTAVEWAIASGTPFSVRSGGHSYTGWSTSTDLVIDVSALDQVTVDRGARTARIGAGARLIDVYHALAAQGFGVAAGSCPSVGVAGLTLGGGIGVLSRAWGLTCDSLDGASVVLADARSHRVDRDHQPDLLWALRGGGGGSFGAVTSFDLALRPAPRVQTFYLTFPYAAAADVLDAWQRWAPRADRRLWGTCHLAAVPSSGSRSISVAGTWIGPSSTLGTLLDTFVRRCGTQPGYRSATPHSYESAMLLEAGCDAYAPCHLAPQGSLGREPMSATSSMLPKPLDSKGIATVLDRIDAGLGVTAAGATAVAFDSLGGAVDDVSATGTAYGHRGAIASLQYTATWSERHALKDPRPMDDYVRGFRAALKPWCGEAAYVNYQDAAIRDYGQAYWGRNYRRLREVKRRVDPREHSTFPQAVRP